MKSVVFLLVVLLFCLIGFPTFCNVDKAFIVAVETDIKAISNQAKVFKQETGRFPSSIEQLAPEYLKMVPVDPWGNVYQYSVVAGTPYVISLGKDRTTGGSRLNQDLSSKSNWQKILSEI